jgi:hypothetical protein
VLGRSLDELPPQTRRVLAFIVGHVRAQAQAGAMRRADVRFTRGELRTASGLGDTQLKIHLARLVELEYLITHRAERGQGFTYELLFDGDAAASVHLSGLIDVEKLTGGNYDAQRSGRQGEQSASGRGEVGQKSVGDRAGKSLAKPALVRVVAPSGGDDGEMSAMADVVPPVVSYSNASSLAAAV